MDVVADERLEAVCASGMQIAHDAVESFIASFVQFGDLSSEHADGVQDIESATAREVQDFHQNARSRRSQRSCRLEVVLLEVGVVKTRGWGLSQGRDWNVCTFQVAVDTLIREG